MYPLPTLLFNLPQFSSVSEIFQHILPSAIRTAYLVSTLEYWLA